MDKVEHSRKRKKSKPEAQEPEPKAKVARLTGALPLVGFEVTKMTETQILRWRE